MSLINQMLKDLEDRKESESKGQDSIISQPQNGARRSRMPILLLSLVSLILLTIVLYLLWQTQLQSYLAEQEPAYVAKPKSPAPVATATIATLIQKSDSPVAKTESATVIKPTIQKIPPKVARAATPVIIQPRPIKRAAPSPLTPPITPKVPKAQTPTSTKPLLQPEKPQPLVVQNAAKVTNPSSAQDLSISHLLPATLKGDWRPQPLTIVGKNFTPESQILICWPAKCATLKGYRIRYRSSNQLQISITTGIKPSRWHLSVINPDGARSNNKNFDIIAPKSIAGTAPIARAPQSTLERKKSAAITAADSVNRGDDIDGVRKQLLPLTSYQQAEKYHLKAQSLGNSQDRDQAIALWKKALLLAPEHHASRQALVKALIASARIVEAEQETRQAIQRFPNHAIYTLQLAQIHVSNGDNISAIVLIEDARNRGVTSAELYAFGAALYQREKRSQESIEYYQQALTLKPDSGLWWMGLAISFEQNSQFSKALSAFQRALNSSTLSRKLRRYVEGQITLNRKRVEAAQRD